MVMIKIFLTWNFIAFVMLTIHSQNIDLKKLPVYTGSDLGVTYSPEKTVFKLWSPLATGVSIQLKYEEDGVYLMQKINLELETKTGVWKAELKGDQKGKAYTFQVEMPDGKKANTPGIYAKAIGANGMPGYVVDLEETNPEGWENDQRPLLESFNDIILYEMHVRDMTSHPSSGSSKPTKLLGLTEQDTKNSQGLSTGIDHLKEMGVTHVHILPSFDFKSVDETRDLKNQYNWGYDPVNYNVPEGSYSSDPWNPRTRIREFKQMVKEFHDNGIRVVMDVVYNHTADAENSNFDLEFPGYYYRYSANGQWSNASGCGNETASERYMMRKYMLESVKYWVEEYHVDGFRFDLMAVHDIETMNLIAEELHKIDPTIFIYGEGWTAGTSPLPQEQQALKMNAAKLNGIAVFSDDIRDGIKGSVFEESSKGFVGGDAGHEEDIKFGIVAGVGHPQINMKKVHYSDRAWSPGPTQTISYVSCHDNHTLFDKLKVANPDASPEEINRMHKLSLAIVLTSQGVPFLHAGSEMMRTKRGEHNSYNLPDAVNQINWDWKNEHADVVAYTKGLIALRKAEPALRLRSAQDIQEKIIFIVDEPGLVAYTITDANRVVTVVFNARKEVASVEVGGEVLSVYDAEAQVWIEGVKAKNGKVSVAAQSASILAVHY